MAGRPPATSYEACIASLAVRLVAPEREGAYLRAVRRAIFLQARNVARADVLEACAMEVGVDARKFRGPLDSGAARRFFEQQRAEMRQLPVRGFPTLTLQQGDQPLVLYGAQTYSALREALFRLSPGPPQPVRPPSPEQALQAYGEGTEAEFAELLEVDETAVAALLRQARAEPEPAPAGTIWRA